MAESVESPWLVVCLCANWCNVCNEYQPAFEALAAQHPQWRFAWLDVEDDEEALGSLDVETFPSVLVGRAEGAVFWGPLLPQAGVLQRMLVSFGQSDGVALPAGDAAHGLLQRVRALLATRAA